MMNLQLLSLLFLCKTVICYDFECPSFPHWIFRAKAKCKNTDIYRCLWDINAKRHIEQCQGMERQMKGFKLIFAGNTDKWPCTSDRYQPFMYTTKGNFECIYKKSTCNQIGQIVYNEGTTTSDRTCRCNHTAGYTFLYQPQHYCYCQPAREDCSCIIKTCPHNKQLNIDYECRSTFDRQTSFKCAEIPACYSASISTPRLLKAEDKSKDSKFCFSSKKHVVWAVLVCLSICLTMGICSIYHTKAIFNQEKKFELACDRLEKLGMPFNSDEEQLRRKLESCTTQKLNFGITGGTAVGKSTFINLLLGTKRGDPNYAETGQGDTTLDVKTYHHPKCNRFTITDMPGYGTAKITKKEFLKRVRLSEYDYFLLFFDTVIKEDDIWLAKRLVKKRIPFAFVRTKLDMHIEEEKSKGIDLEDAIRKLRQKLNDTISKANTKKDIKLFLISATEKYILKGDLITLMEDIAHILPEEKSDSFLFFLPILTPQTIEMKYKLMEVRASLVIALALHDTFVPAFWHFRGRTFDLKSFWKCFEEEIENYIHVFGLDKEFVPSVPGLKHTFFYKKNVTHLDLFKKFSAQFPKSLFPKEMIYSKSYLLKNLTDLRDDALTVYNHFFTIATRNQK